MRGRHDQASRAPGGDEPPGAFVSGAAPGRFAAAYRPEIDGLRAVAVLAVLLYHVDARLLPGGFVGVDVFFVISGYLIGGQLLGEIARTGRIDYPAFLARRFRRLMPALLVVLAVALPVSAMLLAAFPSELAQLRDSGLMSAIYLANVYFEGATGGYFDTPVDRVPLLHLWSLAVEEQFYLVFPLVLWLAAKAGSRGIGIAILVLALLSLAAAEHLMRVDPKAAFYAMAPRFWELAVGVLVARIPPTSLRTLLSRFGGASVVVGLAAIAFAVAVTNAESFPGMGALLPVAGAGLVILAVHAGQGTGLAGRMLACRPMVWIGLVSYPLYLWHWPILVWDRILTLEPNGINWRLGLGLGSVVLAWLTYRFVESPVRHRAGSTRVALVGAAAGMALMALLAASTPHVAGFAGVKAGDVEAVSRDRPTDTGSCHFRLGQKESSIDPGGCTLSPGQGAAVVVWGDSHALAWRPFAQAVAAGRGAPLQAFSMDSCLPLGSGAPARADYPAHARACDRLNAQVLAHVRSSRPRLVIVAGRWAPRLGAGTLLSREEDQERARNGWVARYGDVAEVTGRLRSTLAALAESGAEVLVIGPAPVSRYDVARCVAVGSPSQCALDRSTYRAQSAEAWKVLVDASRGLDSVRLIDPADYFCGEATCEAVRDGKPMFWDDDHVSSSAARDFASRYLQAPDRYLRKSN